MHAEAPRLTLPRGFGARRGTFWRSKYLRRRLYLPCPARATAPRSRDGRPEAKTRIRRCGPACVCAHGSIARQSDLGFSQRLGLALPALALAVEGAHQSGRAGIGHGPQHGQGSFGSLTPGEPGVALDLGPVGILAIYRGVAGREGQQVPAARAQPLELAQRQRAPARQSVPRPGSRNEFVSSAARAGSGSRCGRPAGARPVRLRARPARLGDAQPRRRPLFRDQVLAPSLRALRARSGARRPGPTSSVTSSFNNSNLGRLRSNNYRCP